MNSHLENILLFRKAVHSSNTVSALTTWLETAFLFLVNALVES